MRARLSRSDEIAQCTRDEQVEPRCHTTRLEAGLYTMHTEGLGAVVYVESVRRERGYRVGKGEKKHVNERQRVGHGHVWWRRRVAEAEKRV